MKDFIIYFGLVTGCISILFNLGFYLLSFLINKNFTITQKIVSIAIGIVFILFSAISYLIFYIILSFGYIIEEFLFFIILSPAFTIIGIILFALLFIIIILIPLAIILIPFYNNEIKTYKFFLSFLLCFIALPLSYYIFNISTPYILKPVNFVNYNKVANILDRKPIQQYYKYFIYPLKTKDIKEKYSSEEYMFLEQFPILVGKENLEKFRNQYK